MRTIENYVFSAVEDDIVRVLDDIENYSFHIYQIEGTKKLITLGQRVKKICPLFSLSSTFFLLSVKHLK